MKERTLATFISIFLILAGILFSYAFYAVTLTGNFNFYKSEISVSDLSVSEKLNYRPDEAYHTLYRNFVSPITIPTESIREINSVTFNSVSCSAGQPYVRTYNGCYSDDLSSIICPQFTEANEYGCTFGAQKGFRYGADYFISAEYSLAPQNLFLIDNNHYVKFIAYSKNNHNQLIVGENFFLNPEIIHNSQYNYGEDVILYVPYNGDTSPFTIINQEDFEFDERNFGFFTILYSILPGVAFFLVWFYFGKEKSFKDIPESGISFAPSDRKPWHVAAYFSPPLSILDKNFMSALLLDLYNRKIIDVRVKSKKTFLKVVKPEDSSLDKVESLFLTIISKIREIAPEKYLDGQYLNMKDAMRNWKVQRALKYNLRFTFLELRKEVKKIGKTYFSQKGVIVIGLIIFLAAFISFFGFFRQNFIFFFYIFCGFFIAIVSNFTTLLISYKEQYYAEYQHWQGFKKYLNAAPSLKEHGHKGIVLWEKYLIYGAALGVSKRVIKELEHRGEISNKQGSLYLESVSLSTSVMGSSGSGGSFGGAAGGGVGGGGGGGR